MNGSGQPLLDLAFLGMGEDGHVASLFPGAWEAAVRDKSVYLPVVASKPPPQRITLNFAALVAARHIWVLASGAGKENALRESLSANGTTPLARVLQAREQTLIFTDLTGPF
jgi:6-phosphogluconolactonase